MVTERGGFFPLSLKPQLRREGYLKDAFYNTRPFLGRKTYTYLICLLRSLEKERNLNIEQIEDLSRFSNE